MLASRVQPVRAPEDESIVADLTELREIAQAREGGRRTSVERETELRQRVRERAWQHQGSGEVAEPVALDELRAALDAETALIAYVVTAETAVALVVTTDGVDLGRPRLAGDELDGLLGGLLPDLDVAASDLPDTMGRFVREELAGRLATLADLLVAPVLDAVGERRVVLTPSGVLAGVPWTLLPGLAGRPVTVAQSATAWLARRTPPLRSATAGFVAGPRVVRAEDEVTAAAKEWEGAGSSSVRPPTRPRSRSSPRRSMSSTSPRTAGTRRRTHSSPASSSPTGRGSATTSIDSDRHPTWCCCRRARWGARTCAGARSCSG